MTRYKFDASRAIFMTKLRFKLLRMRGAYDSGRLSSVIAHSECLPKCSHPNIHRRTRPISPVSSLSDL